MGFEARNTEFGHMFFSTPMILHSRQPDGRHWLTSMDIPPLQIWPVATNHCRAGHFLATLVTSRLSDLEGKVPKEIKLSRTDVAATDTLAKRYPELAEEAGEVQVRLASKPAPELSGEAAEEEEMEFVTPQPPKNWKHTYDAWIRFACRSLGMDVPPACGPEGYDHAMAEAARAAQKLLPSLRKRFMAGMEGLNLGFKIALTTRRRGKEYVWVRPTNWRNAATIDCVLESQPHDCKGYKLGQKLHVQTADVLDYCVGSEKAGVVEAGFTQRIAEDYGLMLPP